MKPDQNVYYKKTYRKLGIILWHLIIRKKKKNILEVKYNYWIFIQVSETMDKKLPKFLPKPTLSDLKVNTLFSKAIENGFSDREVRDYSMHWLVIPTPPENLTVPYSL